MSHNHTIPTRLAESPVPGNRHAGFGGRVEETGRPRGQYRASARPYNYTIHKGPNTEPVSAKQTRAKSAK
jgi:hypothetical protein